MRRSLLDAGVNLSTIFGLLVANGDTALAGKVVDEGGAELFEAMRRPGRLPAHASDRLAELVLDGVLEIEANEGWVSGPIAYEAVVETTAFEHELDRLGRLSHAAVAHAQRLGLTEVERTMARLYFYNRVPVAARWERAYPRPSAVLERLACPALSRHWVGGLPADERAVDWLSWSRCDEELRDRADRLVYKLYVSPAVEALPDVLAVLADTLTEAGAQRFKVGPDAAGLLRPDKIVVYMADVRELEDVARALTAALDGVPAHGVPFTAQLAGDGLLSWGGDPPRDAGPVGGSAESWRVSVSRRLAEYLLAAHAAPLRRISPADYALARLGIDGINVRSFAPAGLQAPAEPELVQPIG